jgi:hypothetical protein
MRPNVIYTHVLNKGGCGVSRPLDVLSPQSVASEKQLATGREFMYEYADTFKMLAK